MSLLIVTQEAQAQTWRLRRRPSTFFDPAAPPAPLTFGLRRGLHTLSTVIDPLILELVPDSRKEHSLLPPAWPVPASLLSSHK